MLRQILEKEYSIVKNVFDLNSLKLGFVRAYLDYSSQDCKRIYKFDMTTPLKSFKRLITDFSQLKLCNLFWARE